MEYNVRQVNNFISDYPTDAKLQKDKDITLAVLARNPAYAAYADKALLKDRDVAMCAVEKDGRTLRFFDDSLKSDEDVAYAAVKNFRSSFAFTLGKARDSRRIAAEVASAGGDVVAMLDKKFLDDEEIAKVAVGRNPKAIQYFTDRIRCIPSVALLALKQDRTVTQYLPDEAFENDAVFRAAVRITDDGKVGVGVINEFTPLGLFEKLRKENMKFNFSLQNLDLSTLDGARLRYVIELGLGVTGKKAEIFHKFVDKDDRETVSFLLAKKFPSAKTVATELEYASKNRKLRVLPSLISATRGGKRGANESDERKMLVRNLKRKSPMAAAKLIDGIDDYAHDEEAIKLAASVDGGVIRVLYRTDFAGDKNLVTDCLKTYVVKNSDEPLLKNLKGIDLDFEQCRIACRRDGRNYFYLPEQFRGSELLKEIAYASGAEGYEGDKS